MSNKKKLSRRDFLRTAAVGAAGLAVASCAPAATQVPEKPVATSPAVVPTEAPTAVPPTLAPVTLEFWDTMGYGADADNLYQKMCKDYTTANPNTTVNYTPVSFDQSHEKLVTAFAAGSGPDIWSCTGVYNAEFAASQYNTPLDTLAVDLVKNLVTAVVDAVRVKRKTDSPALYQRDLRPVESRRPFQGSRS